MNFRNVGILSRRFREMLQELADNVVRRDEVSFGPNMRHRNIPGEPLWMDSIPRRLAASGNWPNSSQAYQSSSGHTSETFTIPRGVSEIFVVAAGAGGGGGGGEEAQAIVTLGGENGTNTIDHEASGRGGGGGGSGSVTIAIAHVLASETLVINTSAGGSGGSADTDGGDGADTEVKITDADGMEIDTLTVGGGNGGSSAGAGGFASTTTLTDSSDRFALIFTVGGNYGLNGRPRQVADNPQGGEGAAAPLLGGRTQGTGDLAAGGRGGAGNLGGGASAGSDGGQGSVFLFWRDRAA